MSCPNVLSALLEDSIHHDRAFYCHSYGILLANNSRTLKQWGAKVSYNPVIDPAKELLRTLIFADAPSILAAFMNPWTNLIHTLYPDTGLIGMRDDMTPLEFANRIDSVNTKYNDEGIPDGVYSKTLIHLANYIRGDLIDPTPLLHALTERVWREADQETYNRILATTFLFHTYLFYFKGFRAERGIQQDRLAWLAGAKLPEATQDQWDNDAFQQFAGHPAFGVLPLVNIRHIDDDFTVLDEEQSVVIGENTLVFYDYGDTGLALRSHLDNPDLRYFLSWPEEYEEALQTFFYPKDDYGHPQKTWGGEDDERISWDDQWDCA